MPCSPSFVEHALDLLSEIGPVEARRLFGGYGLYARGVGAMVGLLDDDELFLRIDDQTLHLFTAAGCRRWEYPGAGEGGTHYYRPPDEAHEDAEAMGPWARLGLAAAQRLHAARAAKAAATAARRATQERKAKERPSPGARKPATTGRKVSAALRRPRAR